MARRRKKTPAEQHDGPRVCIHPDCDTRLSIYNEHEQCAEHRLDHVLGPRYRRDDLPAAT